MPPPKNFQTFWWATKTQYGALQFPKLILEVYHGRILKKRVIINLNQEQRSKINLERKESNAK